jgi:cytochrome c peroxidase
MRSGSVGLVTVFVIALSFSCSSCDDKKNGPPPPTTAASSAPSATPAKQTFDPSVLSFFAPLPESAGKPAIDDVVKLGQALYFDARLSKGQDLSCASCHDLAKAGIDGQAQAVGNKKTKSKYNTPTVLNAAGSYAHGWLGQSSTLEELVVPHVVDASIMGMGEEKKIVELVASIPGYAPLFKKAFPDEKTSITGDTISRALATYVKKLLTPSKWDDLLRGEKTALSEEQLAGVMTFIDAGCTSCHQGKYIGASQGQKLGVAKPWPGPAGAEPGRFEVSKQEADRGVFKVPSLRNVTKTAPYIHDGSIATLEETVRLMAKHQAGKELTDAQVKSIVVFLGALSGEPAKELTTKPDLPASGPKTPKPE